MEKQVIPLLPAVRSLLEALAFLSYFSNSTTKCGLADWLSVENWTIALLSHILHSESDNNEVRIMYPFIISIVKDVLRKYVVEKNLKKKKKKKGMK